MSCDSKKAYSKTFKKRSTAPPIRTELFDEDIADEGYASDVHIRNSSENINKLRVPAFDYEKQKEKILASSESWRVLPITIEYDDLSIDELSICDEHENLTEIDMPKTG